MRNNISLKNIIRKELYKLKEQKFRGKRPTPLNVCPLQRPSEQQLYESIRELNLRTVGDAMNFIEELLNLPELPLDIAPTIEAMYLELPKDIHPTTVISNRNPKIWGFLLLAATCWLFWRCMGGEGVV